MIGQIFSRLLNIALLRAGPDSLPASPVLLVSCVAFWLAERVAFAHIAVSLKESKTPFLIHLGAHIVYAILIAAFFHTLLSIKNRRSRFLQTVTALFGAESLIDLLGFLSLIPGSSSPLAVLIDTVDFFWCILLLGFVMHRAFDISRLEGFIHGLIVFLTLNLAIALALG